MSETPIGNAIEETIAEADSNVVSLDDRRQRFEDVEVDEELIDVGMAVLERQVELIKLHGAQGSRARRVRMADKIAEAEVAWFEAFDEFVSLKLQREMGE